MNSINNTFAILICKHIVKPSQGNRATKGLSKSLQNSLPVSPKGLLSNTHKIKWLRLRETQIFWKLVITLIEYKRDLKGLSLLYAQVLTAGAMKSTNRR